MKDQTTTITMTPQRDTKKTHQPNDEKLVTSTESENDHQTESKNPPPKPRREEAHAALRRPPPAPGSDGDGDGGEATTAEVSGRERLKRHRVEVAGRVWIPELWGQEELLKDWIDCTTFDASLGNRNITLARAALVEDGRRIRASSSGLMRIENRC